jgi:hypothetical protein
MKSQNVIITILLILAVFLAAASYSHTKKTNEVIKSLQQTPIMQIATSTATTTPVVRPETFPKQFMLSISGSYKLGDGTTITLTDLNDSHCPSDPNINCVWAGNVIAKLHIQKGSEGKDVELTLPGNNVLSYNQYKISFDKVQPDSKLQSSPVAKNGYRLTLTVSR